MKVGDIRITPGFNLGMDIMFVQGPKYWDCSNPSKVLFEVYSKMLQEAYDKGYQNILLPSLGTGDYGFEHEHIGKGVSTILSNFTNTHNINVDLVLFDENSKKYY